MTNSSNVSSILNDVLGGVSDLPLDTASMNMETQHLLRDNKYKRVGKLVEQPKDVTNKIISPVILNKINDLYKLIAHKDGLLNNCSISFSVAQEIFTMLPEEYAKEVNKTTKNPSKNNYTNIVKLVDEHIHIFKQDLNILAATTKDVINSKVNAIADNNLIDRLYTIIDSLYSINKTSVNRIIDGDHILYSNDKKFVKIDNIALSAMDTLSTSDQIYKDYVWELKTLSWDLLNRANNSLLTFLIVSTQILRDIDLNVKINFEPEVTPEELTINKIAVNMHTIGNNIAHITDKLNELIMSFRNNYIDLDGPVKELENYLVKCDNIMPFLDSVIELNQSDYLQCEINDLSKLLQIII